MKSSPFQTESEFEEIRQDSEAGDIFRTVFHYSGVAMAIVDSGWRIIRANPAFLALTGYSPGAITGGTSLASSIITPKGHPPRAVLPKEFDKPCSLKITLFNHQSKHAQEVILKGSPLPGGDLRLVTLVAVSELQYGESASGEDGNLLEMVADALPYGLIILDRNLHYMLWNRAMEHLTMIPRAEVLGEGRSPELTSRPLWDLGVDTPIHRAMQGETSTAYDLPFVRADGEGCFLNAVFAPLRSADEKVSGIVGVIRDGSAEKKLIDTLRETQFVYRGLIRQSAEGLLLADEEGKIIEWNRGMHEITGYPGETILGRPFWEIQELLQADPPDTAIETEELVRHHREFVRTGKAPWLDQVHESTIRRADGEERTIEEIIFGIQGECGYRTGGTIRDITVQKKMRDTLERHSRQISVIHDVASTAISCADLDKMLEVTLKKTLDLFGYDGGAIYLIEPGGSFANPCCTVGITPQKGSPAGSIAIKDGFYRQVYCDGIARFDDQGDTNVPHSATFWPGFRSTGSIPLTAHGTVLGALHIGSRSLDRFSGGDREALETIGCELGVLVEQALLQRKLGDAFAQANLYLDIMSHDIANIHTASLGYAELLAEILEGSEQEFVTKLVASIRQGINILNSVATIRRLHEEEVDIRAVDLDEVIQGEIRHFPDTSITYSPTGIRVLADDLFGEVFTNLIGNSLKFGGDEVRIMISARVSDGRAEVRVADTGPGIPAEEKQHIFDRFRQGRSSVGGKGLGLSIVRMLIERYGSEIRVMDRVAGVPDAGVAFVFALATAGPEDLPMEGGNDRND